MKILRLVILFFLGAIILQVMYGLFMNVLERGNFWEKNQNQAEAMD